MTKKVSPKAVVDTNVPKTANLSNSPALISDDLAFCVAECVNAVENIIKKGGLVMDDGNDIFDEYRKQLSMSGEPGIGDKFLKWVHYHRFGFPPSDRVPITKNGDSYDEFPNHEALRDFDMSDRKFVAVANRHADNPPILEATDSKWWGWKEALKESGISVRFLCPDYIRTKYQEKMGK
nr:hypothetical protein [Desulfobacula sp.]